MLLAELIVRHTRRHMPTRRVALETAYLPTSGSAHGSALISTLVAVNLPHVPEEQVELLPRLIDQARTGFTIPRIALRHRLQVDTHGLDRSRHRVIGENGHLVVELDRHGAATPQVLGAVMAAAAVPSSARGVLLDSIARVVEGRWRGLAVEVEVRQLWDRQSMAPPPLAGRGRGLRAHRPKKKRGGALPPTSVGPWRYSVCAPAWTSSEKTSTGASAACCATRIPTRAAWQRRPQRGSPS